ncbi:acyclic terpene utilization AtuA family protein [Shouchella shacheensis]|uniref:acyclic terpene utilization AtuA family protein n=1 Tax=Shouchella shacheensis TaxID=1649580 RepID=UPI00073FCB40|nr:acyclic terpene utilization AtuA family protein [Shouchella shacheensis]
MVTLLAASGMLGTGFSIESFNRAMKNCPDMIGCDAGSTDPGPYYLGSGRSMASKESVKRDLGIMLRGAVEKDIPLIVGSAGTAGGNKQVEWTVDIIREIAEEEDFHFPMAKIYSEIDKDLLLEYYSKGKIKPLENAPTLGEEQIRRLKRVVGQMGPEPIIDALNKGAKVIIAGRSSDTSIFSALPIQKGISDGKVWHAAKIIECGAGCVENRKHPDSILAMIHDNYFTIESPNPQFKVTPLSVLSHLMYENQNPYQLVECNGTLKTEAARYESNGKGVDVFDSEFSRSHIYTTRLEGVEHIGHRRIAIGGIRDPFVLMQLSQFIEEAVSSVNKKVQESLGIKKEEYDLSIRTYGASGVMGERESHKDAIGHEVGILFDVIAQTPDKCNSIMSILWHTVLHHPIKEWSGLVSQIAFPFSPPDADMGEVYEFSLNHVVELQDPLELVEIHHIQI